MSCSVLIVTTNPADLAAHERAFIEAGFFVTAASSFEEARRRVDAYMPDVLVAALRLGDFNGLHLATVTRMSKTRPTTVVMGEVDTDSEADAIATGSHFLVRPAAAELVGLVRRMRKTPAPVRRSRRVRVEGQIPIRVGTTTGRLMDVSPEGLRLTLCLSHEPSDAQAMRVSVGDDVFDLRGMRRWTRPASDGMECGLLLGDRPSQAETAWQRFVVDCRLNDRPAS